MSAEVSGQGKFTETVTNHIFGNEDIFEDLAIMDGEGEANKLRRDLTTTRPGFDGFLFSGHLKTLNFGNELFVDKWSFD
jgi:hypothetical protein